MTRKVPLVLTAKIRSKSSGGSDSTDALKATPAFEVAPGKLGGGGAADALGGAGDQDR